MKKNTRNINLLDISQIEKKSLINDRIKTTNINILLNRVKNTKKNEFKKKILYLSLLLIAIFTFTILSLI
tara:strand:+ start:157 stop:366 length:210 start_codon:yes stop_codon:yes gene_type:complete